MGRIGQAAMTVAAQMGLSERDRLVVAILAVHERNGVAFPGLDTLTKESGLERRRIQESLRRLEAVGLIETDVGRGRGKLSTYTLTPEKAQVPGGDRAFYDDADDADEKEKAHDSRNGSRLFSGGKGADSGSEKVRRASSATRSSGAGENTVARIIG